MSAEALGNPRRRRGVAAGAPDLVHLPTHDPYHAVVAAHVDGTVVDQEVVGDLSQLLGGLLVPVGYGLVGVVAARHHERDTRVVQQQVVQRGVSEHDAQGVLPRSHLLGYLAAWQALQEHYRARRGGEQLLFFGPYPAELSRLLEVAGHEREGLVLAHLATP